MADSARLTHVSPGIYSRETEITYAVKSLGITTLGLVGETKKGPAFQPVFIENWRDFNSVFGGTSTEKFAGSQYPKYELPYVAKSYLSESNQLQVCRVLGLSGYNAGPAWCITAHASGKGDTFGQLKRESGHYKVEGMVVAVIRSRGQYYKYNATTSQDACGCSNAGYDSLVYNVGEVVIENCNNKKTYNGNALKLTSYTSLSSYGNDCDGYILKGDSEKGDDYFAATSSNYGRFKIAGFTGAAAQGTEPNVETQGTYFEYAVSLNPSDNDYILKVLGTDPYKGDAPIYVESLYDVAYQQLVDTNDLDGIHTELSYYTPSFRQDYSVLKQVNDFLTETEESLTRKHVGRRYVADKYSVETIVASCHPYDYVSNKPIVEEDGELKVETVKLGQVYTVKQYTDSTGKRHYFYTYFAKGINEENIADSLTRYSVADKIDGVAEKTTLVEVEVASDGRYFRINGDDLSPVTCDMNDYREGYRFASTPWVVSNLKGDADKLELNKLFRFHTISDGDSSNNEIKLSIANIRPDEGVFDVIVRRIDDSDTSMSALETFAKCNLIPGSHNYIAYQIGSYDGSYESKSKYITVEVNESDATKASVPAGFLGYPLSKFDGLPIAGTAQTNVVAPYIKYNLYYDEDIKNRKQFFGLSDLTGVDIDMFTYKGAAAYGSEPDYLSQGFHLDSRLDMSSYSSASKTPSLTVDGISGYEFDAVAASNRTQVLTETPVIATEAEMAGSIYENVNLRKFTMYFYGGFDGWDVYRTSRSNTDEFKITKYKGNYNSTNGVGYSVSKILDPEAIGLNQQGITSDWYAYLAAARQFANPEAVDINVFATPGIDLVNNTTLSQEIIEMLEEERADSIYVAAVPDKPFGANDYVDEMYTPTDIVNELENTEIDSNYTCTYYPWVKYEDTDNNQYIYLPPTKDVVRNMAMTDNTAYPWFAPAGVTRGDVNCVKAHYVTKLADEDTLYEGRINPVKTFASDGVKIWGQKNLQSGDAQLTRIAVRRLLLRMRKLIAIACNGLIFEPNDTTTKTKFLSTITPIMDNIKSNRGISDYKIEVNDSVEARERRELPAKIYFKPYKALEYITLDFVVTPESVDFDSI